MTTNVAKKSHKSITNTTTKTQWQRKTYPLKLKLSEEQQQRIDTFLEEYKKTTNFVIDKAVNHLFPFYKRLPTPDKQHDWPKGTCSLCNKQKDLKFKWKTPNGKTKGNCGCLNGHYSMRKLFLPSKNYKIEENDSLAIWDMRFAGKLYDGFPKMVQGGDTLSGEKEYNRGVYDSCLQKAVETIKSQNEINRKIEWQINSFLRRNTSIQRLLSNGKPDARHKQDMEFYSKFDKKKLKKFLAKNNEKLRRLEKKRAEEVVFKGNMARIYEKYYSWTEKQKGDFRLILNLFEKPMELDFFGNEYQKKKAQEFVAQERQPEIELLRRNSKNGCTYWIQYIFRQAPSVPEPDETFTAVGVDLGILNHFAIACLKKDSKKPFGIRFWNGRPLRRKRRQYYKIRSIWQKKTKQKEKGGKGRAKSWMKEKMFHQNEQRFVKTEMHKATTALVQYVHNKVNKPVLVLEDLKDIRDSTKKMKRSHLITLKKKLKGKARKWYLKERYLNKEWNSWNFADMHKFIQYKAEWLGIPVVVLPAKDTSIECNRCGHVDEKNYADLHQLKFVCQNCGYQCNIDFNAAYNLTKRWFAI
jgi:transposase